MYCSVDFYLTSILSCFKLYILGASLPSNIATYSPLANNSHINHICYILSLTNNWKKRLVLDRLSWCKLSFLREQISVQRLTPNGTYSSKALVCGIIIRRVIYINHVAKMTKIRSSQYYLHKVVMSRLHVKENMLLELSHT